VKFYDCKTAPSPRRVRIFLAEKNIDLETIEVDLASREQLGARFREINPDCTVPVLELDDGTHLTEVFAICQYLEEVFPRPALMGGDAASRAQVTMWNSKIEYQGLMALAETFRNRAKGMQGRALTGPHDFDQIPALVERGRRRFELFVNRLDKQLDDSEFIIGDEFTIADISALVAIDFAAWSKFSIGDEQRNLLRWHAAVAARPSAGA
jgi:glutathione S-transferase